MINTAFSYGPEEKKRKKKSSSVAKKEAPEMFVISRAPLGACLFLEVAFQMSTPRTSALVLSGSPEQALSGPLPGDSLYHEAALPL